MIFFFFFFLIYDAFIWRCLRKGANVSKHKERFQASKTKMFQHGDSSSSSCRPDRQRASVAWLWHHRLAPVDVGSAATFPMRQRSLQAESLRFWIKLRCEISGSTHRHQEEVLLLIMILLQMEIFGNTVRMLLSIYRKLSGCQIWFCEKYFWCLLMPLSQPAVPFYKSQTLTGECPFYTFCFWVHRLMLPSGDFWIYRKRK